MVLNACAASWGALCGEWWDDVTERYLRLLKNGPLLVLICNMGGKLLGISAQPG